ncbi:PREDICTED: uncharacterized protein LOC108369097, partial [Rhagoletis zephyria]|uniref:uncharacterized protein LOC108369097 n=1 Tax=Rhagoletis zephyria TaxID=28612 RepID=UPI00081133D7
MQLTLRLLLITIIIACGFMGKSNAYCSLEKMKKFAMEACEHLFMQEEAREKRSLSMQYDHNLRLLLITIIACGFIGKSNAYCSLEKMKKFAMEACEHLFMQDEAREKRSLSMQYDHNVIHHNEYPKINDKSHYISR